VAGARHHRFGIIVSHPDVSAARTLTPACGTHQSAFGEKRLSGWTRAQVLRDPKFYVLIPSVLAMPYIGTGFFFHQVHLVTEKNWSLSLFASFFVIFAGCQMGAAMLSGLAVDRWGARTLIRFFLLPACAALIILSQSNAPMAGAVFMALFRLSGGMATVTGGAIWAELYGVAHLGAIKALAWALMVFASALSPPMMGVAIDHGITMDTIALASTAFLMGATLLAMIFLSRLNPDQSTKE
jgi:MFS family permease